VRIHYDAEVDALSIVFRDTTVTAQELGEGVVAEAGEGVSEWARHAFLSFNLPPTHHRTFASGESAPRQRAPR
jgi:hypothetical protein